MNVNKVYHEDFNHILNLKRAYPLNNMNPKDIMKQLRFACLVLLLVISPFLKAENEPLRVGITHFSPPFIMESAHQWYGFDIDMMQQICATLNRRCQYVSMPFEKLLLAVKNRTVDVGVSAIIITPERAKLVNFSIPYLTSKTHFLGPQTLGKRSVDLELLKKSKIGVEEGTIFIRQILSMGLQNPTIITYKQEPEVVDALIKGEIDLALVVDSSAIYWQTTSSGELIAIGDSIPYGFGLGVAVKPGDDELLRAINQALIQFQNSGEFQKAYHMYLEPL